MKRRFLAGILAIVLCFSNVSVGAYATSQEDMAETLEIATDATENVIAEDGTVSENAVDEDIISEDGNDGNDTVSGNDTDIETTNENADAPVIEEPVVEEPVIAPPTIGYSMTETFLADTEAPYDGNYLLVANTNTDPNGKLEDTGLLPVVPTPSNSVYGTEYSGLYETEENIQGYDIWGRGLIDPNSFLPELEFDDADFSDSELPNKAMSLSGTTYKLNDKRYFYLENDVQNVYNKTECVCVAVGTHSTVWVPADDPIYTANPELMKTYMSTLATEFDSQHNKMITMFGSDETADDRGDDDGKTALVCYDIWGDGNENLTSYVGGYFYGADLAMFSSGTGSKSDMLHIDSWHGMDRDTKNNVLRNVLRSKGTIIHEFQHLINFSVARDNDPYGYSFETPVYLNEAFSMAAEHLCYGPDVCEERVQRYNATSDIALGNISLSRWVNNNLSSYAISYLFGQYIRTQYKGGDTIYRDAMNQYDGSKDFLGIIADLLEVEKEELLLNFRAALFLKSAEGKYGFKGEEWAESIKQKYVSMEDANLYPGAAIVVPLGESYTPPADAGANINYIGMYSELTEDDITVSISGGDTITEMEGQLQLSASVSPKGVPQAVTFSIPDANHKTRAMVTKDGLVTAISDGTVTVCATSVFNPDKYAEKTITISGQKRVVISKTEEELDEGRQVSFASTDPVDAKLYYTYEYFALNPNGSLQDVDPDSVPDPTEQSESLPVQPFQFTTAGTHVLKVVGIADGYASNLITSVYEIEEVQAPFIEPTQNEDGTYTIEILSQEGTEVLYTTDGSEPVRNSNGFIYTEPFPITVPGWTTVKAIAYKRGFVTSWVREEWNIEVPVSAPQISVESVLGGKKVSMESVTAGAQIYYTLDGSEPDAGSDLYTDVILFDEENINAIKAIAIVDDNRDTRYDFFEDENGNVYEQEVEDTFDASSHISTQTVIVGKTKGVMASVADSLLSAGKPISLYSATGNAQIYYTLDGNNPTTPFKSDIIMPDDRLQIRAYARSKGNEDSDITEFVYVPYRELTKLDLLQDAVSLYANVPDKNTVDLEVEIAPANVYEEQLVWTSSNKLVATVDKYGNVTAVADGTAVITVSSGGLKDTCTVTVGNAIEKITVLNEPLEITKDGGTLQIKTSIEPAKVVDSTLLYSAEMFDRPGDAKGIALIDETGTLKAVKNGVVKVTITPKDNAAEIEPKVTYVTISNQKNYNNQYQPRISASTITLNKQADRGYGLNIYSLGVGTSINSVNIDPTNKYAEAFTVTKNGETGTWDVCFAEGKKEEIRNGTYRIPLIIQSEVAFEGYSYNDTFTMTLRIRVVNNAPRVTAQAVTVNRYYTKSEYPITLRAAGTDVVVTGLADAEGMMFITDFFDVETRDGQVYLKPKQQFGAEGALSDRNSIKGNLLVQPEGYLEQKVPITVYLSDSAPKVVVNETAPVLNYGVMIKNGGNPALYFTFSEKISNREVKKIDDLQMVRLDTEAPDYDELYASFINAQCVDMEDGSVGAMILIDPLRIRPGTYRLPLLITTSTLRDVPVTAKVVVQRATDAPKLTLEKTTLKLNSSYPGEIAFVKVKAISQSNVVLDDFAITAWNDGLLANKDAAVTLVYNDETQRLEATVVGKPAGDTYRFTCIPQYEAGVESEQEITVTVKLHKNTPSVEVSAKGNIDVLRRDDTAVTYSLTKINFTDDIESVKLVSPAKTSGTIRDGKDAFEMSWDEDEETITLKADSDFKFIKGKKYAFRFEITKEHGLEGSDNASAKTILTKDISITPVQTKVGFIIDKTPVFYRFVSSETNTQSINLRTDAGAISKVEVQPGYVAPAGIVEKISEDGVTVESLCFDGVNNYNLKSGSYAFRFDVYLDGQLCEEVNGQAVEKPTTCRVRFVIH